MVCVLHRVHKRVCIAGSMFILFVTSTEINCLFKSTVVPQEERGNVQHEPVARLLQGEYEAQCLGKMLRTVRDTSLHAVLNMDINHHSEVVRHGFVGL